MALIRYYKKIRVMAPEAWIFNFTNRPPSLSMAAIHGLADDDVVEIACKVDAQGPAPVPIGTVGDEVFSIIKAVKAYERLSVDAIIHGSAEYAIRALMAHPLIGAYHVAKDLVSDFMDRQGEYAGQWK